MYSQEGALLVVIMKTRIIISRLNTMNKKQKPPIQIYHNIVTIVFLMMYVFLLVTSQQACCCCYCYLVSKSSILCQRDVFIKSLYVLTCTETSQIASLHWWQLKRVEIESMCRLSIPIQQLKQLLVVVVVVVSNNYLQLS